MAGNGIGIGIGFRQGTLLKLLVRNNDVVLSGGYVNVIGGTPNLGYAPNRTFINLLNKGIVRQSGSISKIKFYYGANTLPSYIRFGVWRKSNGVYDLVQSIDIKSLISVLSINEIILTQTIDVEEGDYLSLSASGGDGIFAISGFPTNSLRYASNASETDFNWEIQSSLSYFLPIQSYSMAPLIVGVGDSIIAGHPGHYSGLENSFTISLTNQILYQLKLIDAKYVYQNMGIGSQTSTQISARFNSDIVALKPKMALINGGVNDIAGGTISKEIFLNNYTTMLNLCVANNIVPVVCKIIPWTNGTNTQMQTRDDWNFSLKTLVDTYSGAICIDFDSDLGVNRPGGDAGNLWNINPTYNADGVHPNLAGYTKMAEVINREIKKKYRFG